MVDLQKARQTQLANIEKRSGKTLSELAALLRSSGLEKHGELLAHLKRELGMGHGDANAVAQHFLAPATSATGAPAAGTVDLLADIYIGPKAALRPIHEALVQAITRLGSYETAPKKGYVNLRRNKQFAMIGPATNTRVELGLNMKGIAATDRLLEQPSGGMCNYKVKLMAVDEVDAQVVAWIRLAFDSAE